MLIFSNLKSLKLYTQRSGYGNYTEIEKLKIYYGLLDADEPFKTDYTKDEISGLELIYEESNIVTNNNYLLYENLAMDLCHNDEYVGKHYTVKDLYGLLDGKVDETKKKELLKSFIAKASNAVASKWGDDRKIIYEDSHQASLYFHDKDWQYSHDGNYTKDQAFYGSIEIPWLYENGRNIWVIIVFGEEVGREKIYKTETINSTAAELSAVVAKWYYIIRNLALLVLMLLLIYSGIRIVIGSTAGEKAKYKERIIDWLVAICLIFVMHYIMFFAVQLVEKITDLVRESTGLNGNAAVITLTEDQYESAKEIMER